MEDRAELARCLQDRAVAVHGLPTLIHRLPTLYRGWPGAAWEPIDNNPLNFKAIEVERFEKPKISYFDAQLVISILSMG
jgi:hypothetical protein